MNDILLHFFTQLLLNFDKTFNSETKKEKIFFLQITLFLQEGYRISHNTKQTLKSIDPAHLRDRAGRKYNRIIEKGEKYILSL